MTIGDKIKKYRKERGLTQKELGNLCGISYKQIGHYEQNRVTPKNDALIKIAKALGVPYYLFFDDYPLTDDLANAPYSDLASLIDEMEIQLISDETYFSNYELLSGSNDEKSKKELEETKEEYSVLNARYNAIRSLLDKHPEIPNHSDSTNTSLLIVYLNNLININGLKYVKLDYHDIESLKHDVDKTLKYSYLDLLENKYNKD